MPLTSPSSSTEENRPCWVRQSRILCERTGPTPGSASRAAASAVLRSTRPPAGPPPAGTPPADPAPAPGALDAPGTGMTSPGLGTTICSPSVTMRARLRWFRSAEGFVPPAAPTASRTLEPVERRTTPGRRTCPTTWTSTSLAVVGAADAPGEANAAGTVREASPPGGPCAAAAADAGLADVRAQATRTPRITVTATRRTRAPSTARRRGLARKPRRESGTVSTAGRDGPGTAAATSGLDSEAAASGSVTSVTDTRSGTQPPDCDASAPGEPASGIPRIAGTRSTEGGGRRRRGIRAR